MIIETISIRIMTQYVRTVYRNPIYNTIFHTVIDIHLLANHLYY